MAYQQFEHDTNAVKPGFSTPVSGPDRAVRPVFGPGQSPQPVSQPNQGLIDQAKGTLGNYEFSGGTIAVDPRYVDKLVEPDRVGGVLTDRAQGSMNSMEEEIRQGRQDIAQRGDRAGQQAYDATYQTSLNSRAAQTDMANDLARQDEVYEQSRRNQFRSSAAKVRSAFVYASAQGRRLADETAALLDADSARQQEQSKAQQLQGILPALLGEQFGRDMNVLGQYQQGRQFRDPIGRDLADQMALLNLAEAGRAAGVEDSVKRIWG